MSFCCFFMIYSFKLLLLLIALSLCIMIKSPRSVPNMEMKVYIKHQIRKVELYTVNATIDQKTKLISKITSILLKISSSAKDVRIINNGYVNKIISIDSLV